MVTRHFYLLLNGRMLASSSSLESAGIVTGSWVVMCGRLNGGGRTVIEDEWDCQKCGMQGCWPTRHKCFRCGHPRYAGGKVKFPERERTSAVESLDLSELLEEPEFVLGKHVAVLSEAAETAVSAHAPAGESTGNLGSFHSAEFSDVMTLSASGCVASACARRSAAALASLAPASRVSSPAVFAVGSHARFTPMHDARNSCSHTVVNPLRDQRCRKVRWSRTVGNRSVVQTVDMSPAPAVGTYRRSANEMHEQRQISRKRQTGCSGRDPGPGPSSGPGGRSGLVGGSLGRAAAFRGIPCSLVMPLGRHQRAPPSLGWMRVCGTEKSGVWVLKGDARTYNLPRNLDDVGVVWERRSGYETAWATPGTSVHVHTIMNVDQFCHKLIPPFYRGG